MTHAASFRDQNLHSIFTCYCAFWLPAEVSAFPMGSPQHTYYGPETDIFCHDLNSYSKVRSQYEPSLWTKQ